MDSQPDIRVDAVQPAELSDGVRRWERYQRHGDSFMRIARRLLGNSDDAEDLLQDVAMRILLHPTGPRDSDSFRAWCYGLLRNAVADFRRSADRRCRADHVGLEMLNGCPQDTADPHASLEARRFVGEDESLLDDKECELLVRRYVLEQTSGEIAEGLETSPAAIRMKLKRTLEKLRKSLRSTSDS